MRLKTAIRNECEIEVRQAIRNECEIEVRQEIITGVRNEDMKRAGASPAL